MGEKNNKTNDKITLLLLQESLWGIEDKLNVIVESIADHDADIIRLKALQQLTSERLSSLESLRYSNNNGKHKNRKY